MSELAAAAVAANGVSLYRWMLSQAAGGVNGGTDVQEENGLLCAAAALPELCVAMRTPPEPGSSRLSDEDAFGRIQRFFAERSIADYLVMVEIPEEGPFEALLLASGFRSDYEELPMVLSAPSGAIGRDAQARDASPALQIREVTSDEDLAQFRAIAGAVFDVYGNGDLVREAFASFDGMRDPRASAFLGLVEGEAVATTFLLLADGIAGVYFVATLPDARGRGVADALVRHAVSRGFAQGASAAVLAATQAGMGIYRRIGFVPTGTIAREFRSPNPPNG